MSQHLLVRFKEHEKNVVLDFHRHPFFTMISAMHEDIFKSYLAQRAFFSRDFVNLYTIASFILKHGGAKGLLHHIILDEAPKDKPSHFEDLLFDLKSVGIAPQTLLTTQQSPITIEAQACLSNLIALDNGGFF